MLRLNRVHSNLLYIELAYFKLSSRSLVLIACRSSNPARPISVFRLLQMPVEDLAAEIRQSNRSLARQITNTALTACIAQVSRVIYTSVWGFDTERTQISGISGLPRRECAHDRGEARQ